MYPFVERVDVRAATIEDKPGGIVDVLLRDFIEPMGISRYRVAKSTIHLQAQYDLEVAERAAGKEIARAVVPPAA